MTDITLTWRSPIGARFDVVRTLGYNQYGEQETDSLVVDDDTHLITEQRDAQGRSTGYVYSRNGTTQQTVTTGYGEDGRISSAGFLHGGAEKQFSYEYLPGTHLLQKLTKPNGMSLTQSYEPQRDLLTGMAYHRGSTLVAQRTYTYDSLGRPLNRSTARSGQTVNDSFGYNNRSELTTATVNGGAYAYDYDNIGNRKTAQEATEAVTGYTANELNQYTTLSVDGAIDFQPEYDADGNQTRIKTSTCIWAITYDTENRPTDFTSVAADNTITTVHCEYDSMGRRSTKMVMVNGNVTLHQRYIYRGYLQIACIDLTRSHHPALWYITWDPTQNIATRPLAIQKDATWYTYGWDLTKNICEVYRNNGTLGTGYTYTPYGQVSASGSVEQPIQWSSEYNDDELGLVYYNYRHYNPADGRWTKRDCVLDDYNLYRTSRNSLPNGFDVKGEWFWFAIPTIVMYGIGRANAPGKYDDPSPKPGSNLGWAIAIDILGGVAVTGILKVGGLAIGEIKFIVYSTRAKRIPVVDIINKSKAAYASSVAFDARTGRLAIGLSGKAKGEVVINRHQTMNDLIEKTSRHFGNSLQKRYPVGNCAEVDAVEQLLQKGSMLKDIRIKNTYANPESRKLLKKYKDPKVMKPCQYCEFMFSPILNQRGVKIETPTIYILPGLNKFTDAVNQIGNGW